MNITIVSKSGMCDLVGDNSQKFLECISDRNIAVPVTLITEEIIHKVQEKLSKTVPENTFSILMKMLTDDINTHILLCTDDFRITSSHISNYFKAVDLINQGMDPIKSIEKAFME
ncbi:hypothetical protein [Flectobacillus roseus]|uniref:hypothetical protein n=1 Tax=Flectobacillus roseus TaxID=502259 RepID=UPI0024B7A63C|nr:hypothetical protein [Flectobacillus roseus]MDI9870601.1 hypothetical protein [Flectobacillus roseus]